MVTNQIPHGRNEAHDPLREGNMNPYATANEWLAALGAVVFLFAGSCFGFYKLLSWHWRPDAKGTSSDIARTKVVPQQKMVVPKKPDVSADARPDKSRTPRPKPYSAPWDEEARETRAALRSFTRARKALDEAMDEVDAYRAAIRRAVLSGEIAVMNAGVDERMRQQRDAVARAAEETELDRRRAVDAERKRKARAAKKGD